MGLSLDVNGIKGLSLDVNGPSISNDPLSSLITQNLPVFGSGFHPRVAGE